MKRSLPPAPALVALLIAIGLVALAAYDGNGGDGTPTPSATEGSPEATVSPDTDAPPFEGTRDVVQKDVPAARDVPAPQIALLTDVRTGRHDESFDRVVFEFLDALPGYRVEYVSPPATQCGSGLETAVAGGALLQVRMTPAAAHDGTGNVTFDTTELTPGLPAILEVESTCDFEGEVTWVLGLSEEVDFRVYELSDPLRVVIDVLHP